MAALYGWDVYNVKSEPYTVNEKVKKTRTITKYRDELFPEEYEELETGSGSGFNRTIAENQALLWTLGADRSGGYDIYPIKDDDGKQIYMWVGARYRKRTRQVKKRTPYSEYEYYYVTEPVTHYRDVKGPLAFTLTSENPDTYPHDAKVGDHWYVFTGLANRNPIIEGPRSDIGKVHKDFDLKFTIRDEDGDPVKVSIVVDHLQVLFPTVVPLGVEQKQSFKIKDFDFGTHKIIISADDGKGGTASKSYTFTRYNEGPTISGSNSDLGAKTSNFSINYTVQDIDGDTVKVKILLDDKIVQPSKTISLGVKNTFKVDVKSLDLGKHTVTIIATDEPGAETRRTYWFDKSNSAPKISGSDISLGAKNTAFTYTYSVTDEEGGPIKVVERLNGEVLSIKENVNLGATYSITVTDEQIQALELNKVNTIEIEASDEYTTTYRRVTFARNNTPPIISGENKDFGEVTEDFSYSFSATDPDKDRIFVIVYLDNKPWRQRKEVEDGEATKLAFDHAQRIRLDPGVHTIKIVATDDKEFSSERIVTFTRAVKKMVVELAENGIPTDMLAKRLSIVTTAVYVAKGDTIQYQVCNNSFDANPTREDATEAVLKEKAYTFTNKTKTADKAGINIRVTITKGKGVKTQSYFTALGGSYD